MKKAFLSIFTAILVLFTSCWVFEENRLNPDSTIVVGNGETFLLENLPEGEIVHVVLGEGAQIAFKDADVENSYIIRPSNEEKRMLNAPSGNGKVYWDGKSGEGILTPSANGERVINSSDAKSSSFDIVHNHHDKDWVITTKEFRDDLRNNVILHREYYVADLEKLSKTIDLSEVAIIQKRGHLGFNFWDYGFTDESGKIVMNSSDNTIKGLLDFSDYKNNSHSKKLGIYNTLRTDVIHTELTNDEVPGESLYIKFVNPIHMDKYISEAYTVTDSINVLKFDSDELDPTEDYILKVTKDSNVETFTCMDKRFEDYDCFTSSNFYPRFIGKDNVGQVTDHYPVPVYATSDTSYFYIGKVPETFIADFNINVSNLKGDGTIQLLPKSNPAVSDIITDDVYRELTLSATDITHVTLKLEEGNRSAGIILHNPANSRPNMMVTVCSNEDESAHYNLMFINHKKGDYMQGGIAGALGATYAQICTHHWIGEDTYGHLFVYAQDDYSSDSILNVYFIPIPESPYDITTHAYKTEKIEIYDRNTDTHSFSDYRGLALCLQNPSEHSLFDFNKGDEVSITIGNETSPTACFSAMVSNELNGNDVDIENGDYYLFISDDNQDVCLHIMKKGADFDIDLPDLVPMTVPVRIVKTDLL